MLPPVWELCRYSRNHVKPKIFGISVFFYPKDDIRNSKIPMAITIDYLITLMMFSAVISYPPLFFYLNKKNILIEILQTVTLQQPIRYIMDQENSYVYHKIIKMVKAIWYDPVWVFIYMQ